MDSSAPERIRWDSSLVSSSPTNNKRPCFRNPFGVNQSSTKTISLFKANLVGSLVLARFLSMSMSFHRVREPNSHPYFGGGAQGAYEAILAILSGRGRHFHPLSWHSLFYVLFFLCSRLPQHGFGSLAGVVLAGFFIV